MSLFRHLYSVSFMTLTVHFIKLISAASIYWSSLPYWLSNDQQVPTTVAVTQVQDAYIRHRLKFLTVYSSTNNWFKERKMPLSSWSKKNRLVWQLNILLPYSFPTLSHMILLHIIEPNFLNIHLNIILPFTASECSIVFRFVSCNFEYLASHAYYTPGHI
jgi:hypothetical protein